MLSVTLCLLRSTWILPTKDGARHRCQFDGAVCASVVLLCWHLLPTWLQPQALRSSLPVSFLPVYVILKTAESPLLLLPGLVWLIIHQPTHNPYSRLLRWYSVPGTIRAARCSLTCYSTPPCMHANCARLLYWITGSGLVRPDPVTGLKLCHYPVSATGWTTSQSVLPPVCASERQ